MVQSNFSGVDGVSCGDCIFGVQSSCYLKPPTTIGVIRTGTGIDAAVKEDRRAKVEQREFCADGINKNTRQQFIEIILKNSSN